MTHNKIPLNYSAPKQWHMLDFLSNRQARAVIWCWLGPLTAGLLIFIAYVFTRNKSLEAAGFLILLFGSALAVASVFLVVIFILTDWRRDDRPVRATLVPAVLLLCLVATNFAAAAAVMWAVDYIDLNHPTQRQIQERIESKQYTG